MSYARYLVRRADWFDSKMSLTCSGRTGGVTSDDGVILDEIKDGDSLDTLIRMADEHRPQCEWALCPADERENPELTVDKRAEVHLKWRKGNLADHDLRSPSPRLPGLGRVVAARAPGRGEGNKGAAGAADEERRQLRDGARGGGRGHGGRDAGEVRGSSISEKWPFVTQF